MLSVIIGSDGYLGQNLAASLHSMGVETISTSRRNEANSPALFLDVTSPESRLAFLKQLKTYPIQYAFICVAQANVDQCVQDPAGSARINVEGTIEICKGLFAQKITPVFFSTDYVFDGQNPSPDEHTEPNPGTEYGRQKAATENWLRSQGEPFLVIRTSKILSRKRHPKNLLTQTLDSLPEARGIFVDDQFFTPFFLEDLPQGLEALFQKRATGFFHFAQNESLSRYDLAVHLAKIRGFDLNSIPRGHLADLKVLEKRPHYCNLNSLKTQNNLGISFTSVASITESDLEL